MLSLVAWEQSLIPTLASAPVRELWRARKSLQAEPLHLPQLFLSRPMLQTLPCPLSCSPQPLRCPGTAAPAAPTLPRDTPTPEPPRRRTRHPPRPAPAHQRGLPHPPTPARPRGGTGARTPPSLTSVFRHTPPLIIIRGILAAKGGGDEPLERENGEGAGAPLVSAGPAETAHGRPQRRRVPRAREAGPAALPEKREAGPAAFPGKRVRRLFQGK